MAGQFGITGAVSPKKVKRALMRASSAATVSHTHSNKSLLDSISQSDFDAITINQNAISAIANVLGITFNANGTLNAESYTSHTHGYDNNGTPDNTEGVN